LGRLSSGGQASSGAVGALERCASYVAGSFLQFAAHFQRQSGANSAGRRELLAHHGSTLAVCKADGGILR